jgi:hypothetical protein
MWIPRALAIPPPRAFEGGVEDGHVAIAPDEGRKTAGPRAVEAGAKRTHSFEVEQPDRLRHPFHFGASEVLKHAVALDQSRRVLGEADVPRLGERLHALRQTDDVALGGEVHAQIVADHSYSADHHLARVEPDAHRERHPVLGAHLVGVLARRVSERQRRVAGPLGVVLVRDRRPEERHDAVAGELVDEALEALDAVGEDREEALHDLRPRLGIHLLGELHRALDVGEEHRHLLALAFERRAGLKNPVGEMVWSMPACCGRRGGGPFLICDSGWPGSGRAQRHAALTAELLAGLVRRAAGRAREGERRAAFGTELPAGAVLMVAGGTEHRVVSGLSA